VEAANALLKVFEEPKDNTFIVLVTDNSHRLLPTISSRAQKINFGPLDQEQFSGWLAQAGITEHDPVYAGRPGYAVRMQQDPEAVGRMRSNQSAFQKFISASLGEKLVLASELANLETIEINAVM
jgi:hypothetical protein